MEQHKQIKLFEHELFGMNFLSACVQMQDNNILNGFLDVGRYTNNGD